MHIVILLIILIISAIYFIYLRKENTTRVFFDSCNTLMADKRVTHDLGPIIEKLVYLVDQRKSLDYGESRVKLIEIFEKTKEIKCFISMETEIKTLFQITDKILESKN